MFAALVALGAAVSAGPLNGPDFWQGITGSPFRCYRDTIITNLTSGNSTTCGTLVAHMQRSTNSHIPCYQHVTTVAQNFVVESAHQGLASLSESERRQGVIKACRPCCGDAYPWERKTDM